MRPWTRKDIGETTKAISGKLQRPQSRERPRQRQPRSTRLVDIKQKHRKAYKQKQAYLNSYKRGLIASYPEYKILSDNIINLSHIELSHDEYVILAKGLSFIPKPKRLDTLELLSDVNNFIREIRKRYNAHIKPRPNRSEFYRSKPYRYIPTDNNKLENILENFSYYISLTLNRRKIISHIKRGRH